MSTKDEMNSNAGEIMERFAALDYMTQRTIQYEFPTIFIESTPEKQNTKNIEHFPTRKFSLNEMFGGAFLACGFFAILAEIIKAVV